MPKFGITKLWCYTVHTLNIRTSTLTYYELLTHHFLFSWMLSKEFKRSYSIKINHWSIIDIAKDAGGR